MLISHRMHKSNFQLNSKNLKKGKILCPIKLYRIELFIFSYFSKIKLNRGGFLKNDASPSGLGHWFRNLGSLTNIMKNLCF